MPDAADAFAGGVQSSLHQSNALALADYQIKQYAATMAAVGVLMDPQTSGGLLAAVPPDGAQQCVMALHQAGFTAAAAIGELGAPDRRRDHCLSGFVLFRRHCRRWTKKTCDGWSKLIHVDKKRVVALNTIECQHLRILNVRLHGRGQLMLLL